MFFFITTPPSPIFELSLHAPPTKLIPNDEQNVKDLPF
jgi:hypothetical protein